jgi:Lrp/AsnC family transcriptional regulator, leucine-responsive regulatory protein
MIMDDVDVRLLELLQLDGRMTISELSKKMNLSRPSITERLHKLEDQGVIEGYGARVSAAALGRNILAIIQMSDLKISCRQFEKMILNESEVLECHRVTGSVSYVMKAAVTGMNSLEALVDRLVPYGNVNTSIVLSSPLSNRILTKKKEQPEENEQE